MIESFRRTGVIRTPIILWPRARGLCSLWQGSRAKKLTRACSCQKVPLRKGGSACRARGLSGQIGRLVEMVPPFEIAPAW